MSRKRHTPEEIVSKLRQVDVLVGQGTPVADAIRAIGVTEVGCGMNCWMASGPPPLVWRGEIRISGCLAQGDRLHAGASLSRCAVAQG